MNKVTGKFFIHIEFFTETVFIFSHKKYTYKFNILSQIYHVYLKDKTILVLYCKHIFKIWCIQCNVTKNNSNWSKGSVILHGFAH